MRNPYNDWGLTSLRSLFAEAEEYMRALQFFFSKFQQVDKCFFWSLDHYAVWDVQVQHPFEHQSGPDQFIEFPCFGSTARPCVSDRETNSTLLRCWDHGVDVRCHGNESKAILTSSPLSLSASVVVTWFRWWSVLVLLLEIIITNGRWFGPVSLRLLCSKWITGQIVNHRKGSRWGWGGWMWCGKNNFAIIALSTADADHFAIIGKLLLLSLL